MSITELLSRLEKVTRRHRKCWQARCPAHEDHSPSLALRELDDGRVLVHCFAGCTVYEIVNAVGLELADLFPRLEILQTKVQPQRKPFSADDILRCIAFEALVVAAAATTRLAGPLSDTDHNRLMLAVTRIHEALAAGGISDAK